MSDGALHTTIASKAAFAESCKEKLAPPKERIFFCQLCEFLWEKPAYELHLRTGAGETTCYAWLNGTHRFTWEAARAVLGEILMRLGRMAGRGNGKPQGNDRTAQARDRSGKNAPPAQEASGTGIDRDGGDAVAIGDQSGVQH